MRARQLQKSLGYLDWRNFYNVIKKCISLSKGDSRYLFKKAISIRIVGSHTMRSVIDFELNNEDVELIKKMSGSHKPTGHFKLRSETMVIPLLQKYYASKGIKTYFQYYFGDFIFDLKIGADILFEFDEYHHFNKSQKIIDKSKQIYAESNNYTVVRGFVQEDIIDIIIKINNAIAGTSGVFEIRDAMSNDELLLF